MVAALVCGCATIKVQKLSQGMSGKQVEDALGAPTQISEGNVAGNRVEAWDFAKDSLGIPNPIDDYWWIIPPTTNVVRVWLLNDRVQEWQATKVRHIDRLKDADIPPEWRTPPDFTSPGMPAFIRQLEAQKAR